MDVYEKDDGAVHVVDLHGGNDKIGIDLDSSFLSAVADRGDTHVIRIDAAPHFTVIASSSDVEQLKAWYTENRSNAYNAIAQEAYVVSKGGFIEEEYRTKFRADEFICGL